MSMTLERQQAVTELTEAQAFVAAQQLINQQNRYEPAFDLDYVELEDVAYRFVLDDEYANEPVAVEETRRDNEGNIYINNYRLGHWIGALASSLEVYLTAESIDKVCISIERRAPGGLM